jgi:hypothetical protein
LPISILKWHFVHHLAIWMHICWWTIWHYFVCLHEGGDLNN